jgi:hypothetical protein
MTRSSACIECHTREVKGQQVPGMQFAGGREFMINGNTIRSANITQDKATGIGNWTEAVFLARFKLFSDPSKTIPVSPTDFQSIMPWYDYGGMKESDLKSIYAYLKTIKPISNKVVKFQAGNLVAAK